MRTAAMIVLLAAAPAATQAQTSAQTFPSQAGPLTVDTIARGLERPWAIAFLPDARLLRLEAVAPLVAEAYLRDHHGLDAAYEAVHAAYTARDPLETARATAAFRFHSDIHLGKEDAHLYRIFRERIPMPEQGKAVGIMAGRSPQPRIPEVVGWLFPPIGWEDRENMVHIYQMVLPPPAFAGIKGLIQKAIPGDLPELVRRIPELEGK